MASSGKRKTTMAKLNRERRLEKQVKRVLRKRASADDAGVPEHGPSDNQR
jgi:hypothetical protein